MNPLIPGVGDVVLAAVVAFNTVLIVLALVALFRSTNRIHWLTIVLLTFLVPIGGPIVALVVLRRRNARGVAATGEATATS